MTIVAGAACPEGIVIAADSRSSVAGPTGHRSATDYARKLFAFDDQFIAATFGWAVLESKTIAGHILDFNKKVSGHPDIHTAAGALRDYFHDRLVSHINANPAQTPATNSEPVGFIVGGNDANGVGHLKRVLPYGGAVDDIARTDAPGGGWNGEVDVMLRLIKGYDTARIDASAWPAPHRKELEDTQYRVNFEWMALQDAIDWTVYVARTTIDTQRFTYGTIGNPGSSPTCGGEIEVATVTPEHGVHWVRRTSLRA